MASAVPGVSADLLDTVLRIPVERTPVVALRTRTGDRVTLPPIRLKLESFNPSGSVKDRTAVGLLRALHRESPLLVDTVVIESTSGNLGVALARLLNAIGCRFVAVIDPNTPPAVHSELVRQGAEVHNVTEPDATGGYLLSRLRTVQRLCVQNPNYRWTNQYENPANPEIHASTTGIELAEQVPDLDTVYVAVSTGGTLAGISRCLRARMPDVRVVAVDTEGSVALGGTPARRLLSGIGASRPSGFLTPDAYDCVVRATDIRSFAICRVIRAQTGLALGGSGGCVLSAALADLTRSSTAPGAPVCVMPDGGRNYESTFYDDEWLGGKGVLDGVRREEAAIGARGLAFWVESEPASALSDSAAGQAAEGSYDHAS
jgi:2,3-diaminopropionate biosynthesis protein SbnA